jgi:hypothetical protein
MRAMRFALFCALGTGCATPAPPTQSPSAEPEAGPAKSPVTKRSQPKKAAPKADDAPVAFDGLSNTLFNDYFNDPRRADAKYKDKRVRLRGRIDEIGRKDGSVFLGYSSAHDMGKAAEPTVVFLFAKEAEKAALDVRKGQIALVEGICRGRIDDGIPRPMGYTFHVRVESCRLVTPEEEGKR